MEHLERSDELRGRAVVDKGNEEGKLKRISRVSSRRGCEYTEEDANNYRSECESVRPQPFRIDLLELTVLLGWNDGGMKPSP